jgi:hypothetical protein
LGLHGRGDGVSGHDPNLTATRAGGLLGLETWGPGPDLRTGRRLEPPQCSK